MVLELDEPTIETFDDFTVAGVAERGTDVDVRELWLALEEYEDELDDVAVGDEAYGVIFELNERNDEFTYVAGVAVESTDGLSAELTGVEIPEGTYVAVPLAGEPIADVVSETHDEWLPESDHEWTGDPMFVRYDPDMDPTDVEASATFYVPVEDVED